MPTSNGWIRVYRENDGKDRTSVHLTDPLAAKHDGTLPDGTRRWSAMTRDGRVAEATAPKLKDAEHQVRTELGVPHVNCCDPLDEAVASFRDALPEWKRNDEAREQLPTRAPILTFTPDEADEFEDEA